MSANSTTACTEVHVAAINDVLAYLACMREVMPKKDLVDLVCGYYSKEEIVTARETYYKIVPERADTKIRKKRCVSMEDNISTILDLMHETPADAHLPLVSKNMRNCPPTNPGSIDNVALYNQCMKVKQESQQVRNELSLRIDTMSNYQEKMDTMQENILARLAELSVGMDRINKCQSHVTSQGEVELGIQGEAGTLPTSSHSTPPTPSPKEVGGPSVQVAVPGGGEGDTYTRSTVTTSRGELTARNITEPTGEVGDITTNSTQSPQEPDCTSTHIIAPSPSRVGDGSTNHTGVDHSDTPHTPPQPQEEGGVTTNADGGTVHSTTTSNSSVPHSTPRGNRVRGPQPTTGSRGEGGEGTYAQATSSPSHTPAASSDDEGFVFPRKRNRKRYATRHHSPPSTIPLTQSGWGTKASGRLGAAPTCQVMVRYLPCHFPIAELSAYVHEMIGDTTVKVEELWRRKTSGSAFVITTHAKYRPILLSGDNWDEHVFVKIYYPPRTIPTTTGGSTQTAS